MSENKLGTHLENARGRMNLRFNATRGTYRLRFTSVHPDQLRTIQHALALAREEGCTQYDIVALEGICLSYLTTGSGDPGIANVAAPVNGLSK